MACDERTAVAAFNVARGGSQLQVLLMRRLAAAYLGIDPQHVQRLGSVRARIYLLFSRMYDCDPSRVRQ